MQVKLIWTMFKKRLKDKAERNMSAAWGMGMRGGNLSVKAGVGLWKALVRPILEYAAEIWGDGEWEEAEKVQREMGRRILGVLEKTTNEAVLGDLGWWQLKARRDMLRLTYWRKLLNMKQDRLPKLMYEWEREEGLENTWCKNTERIMRELGLEDYWIIQKTTVNQSEWNKLIKDRIQMREEFLLLRRMKNKPKLRTYIQFKKKLRQEEYLANEDGIGRRMLARIRSGTNNLRIETGRHEKREVKDRICQVCGTGTEDENHFLNVCSTYNDIRSETKISIGIEDDVKNKVIMFGVGNSKQITDVIKYIKRAMARRKRILEFIG